MDELRVAQDVHIMPMGYEKDRIIEPAIRYDADCAILVDYEPDSKSGDDDVVRPKYHDEVRERLKEKEIQVSEIGCDIFDLYSSLGMIAQLAAEFEEENVYVNLSSGSKVTAIGGMIACMATGATPYYVKADSYAGDPVENPVAEDVTGIIQLPKYPIESPTRQHIACLNYVAQNEPVTKQNLIDFGDENDLPFLANYETAGVKNPKRGYYRRLDSQIIDPLESKGYIEIEERSKYRYISLTENGRNTLQAFRYLWNGDTDMPINASDLLDR